MLRAEPERDGGLDRQLQQHLPRSHLTLAGIYTTSGWWATCTGNYAGFASEDPLWIAGYGAAGTLPVGWSFYTFSQYAPVGTFPGDQDTFNGSSSQLTRLAVGG